MRVRKRLAVSLVLMMLLAHVPGLVQDANARAGGGRSFGGSGSRSYSAPNRSYSSPSPSSQTTPAPGQPAGGGFMRNMGGMLLGGMLGGMLFSMLGFGSPGGGGIGMLEIILFAGIAYFFYTMVMKKRRIPALAGDASAFQGADGGQFNSSPGSDLQQGHAASLREGLDHIRRMDPSFDETRFRDAALDIFFKIQAAWTNRDMSTGNDLVTDQMKGIFQQDMDNLLREKKINRLENIAVRNVEIVEAWQEMGQDYVKALFSANLLDYTVDDETGAVTAGSKTEPVKFEECWTFTRAVGKNPWQLSAISQV